MDCAVVSRLMKFPYLSNYLQLAYAERKALRLTSESQVLFIGGGAMPLTSISLALLEVGKQQGFLEDFDDLFSPTARTISPQRLIDFLARLEPRLFFGELNIRTIDIMPEAIDAATKLVRSLDLEHLVHCEIKNGATVEFGDSVVAVIVASMADPKDSILRNIARQASSRDGVNILVRSVDKDNLRRLLYEPLSQQLVDSLLAEYQGATCAGSFSPPAGSPLINSFTMLSIPGKNIG